MKQFNLLFILFIVFTACNSSSNKENVLSTKENHHTNSKNIDTTNLNMEADSMIFETTNIKIEITPSVFKNDEITDSAVYTIFNGENSPIQFSYAFWIEKLIENKWKKVPFAPNVITLRPMLSLQTGQDREFKFGLSYLFDQKNLGPGHYRLIKIVEKKGDTNKKINLKADFHIH